MVFSCSNIKWPFQRIYLVAVWIRNVFHRLMCLKSYFPVTVIKIPWPWEERFLWACDCGSLASLVQSRDTKHGGWGWELRAHISNHKKQREQTRNGSRFENFKSHFPPERPHLWHLPKRHHGLGTKHPNIEPMGNISFKLPQMLSEISNQQRMWVISGVTKSNPVSSILSKASIPFYDFWIIRAWLIQSWLRNTFLSGLMHWISLFQPGWGTAHQQSTRLVFLGSELHFQHWTNTLGDLVQ